MNGGHNAGPNTKTVVVMVTRACDLYVAISNGFTRRDRLAISSTLAPTSACGTRSLPRSRTRLTTRLTSAFLRVT